MWHRWVPWKKMVKSLAARHGFIDPVKFVSQLQGFAQPSEVAVPIELVRLASNLHSRGLINSQAIQHNLDWVWPYWVERQFDPQDVSFIPRAFSISHINLTHRNWTAVGLPDSSQYSIVDPAGLVTPAFDSWSVDVWIMSGDSGNLIPSRLHHIRQKILMERGLAVETVSRGSGHELEIVTSMQGNSHAPVCHLEIKAFSIHRAWCVVSLRPYNPEGISFIHNIALLKKNCGWRVNQKDDVYLNPEPQRFNFSNYEYGDVFHEFMIGEEHEESIDCKTGLATALAAYQIEPDSTRKVEVDIPLGHTRDPQPRVNDDESWRENLNQSCRLQIPDARMQYLYDVAIRTLILHAPADVYPGPYTYKHFWFRDAALILNAMLGLGLHARVRKVIDHSFFRRQTASGYFHSQDGEWDSNGQALWSLRRYCEVAGIKPPEAWRLGIERAAQWIIDKRSSNKTSSPHAGLLPPGFSAEHLGPNDYYYWDNFWSIAGLQSAAWFETSWGHANRSGAFSIAAEDLSQSVEQSLRQTLKRLGHLAMPASPYRRMDTGAIGSIAAAYPLELWEPRDPRALATAHYLIEHHFVHGGFFHDMSHSGINPYLTLHLAQVLLRAGDSDFFKLVEAISQLATPAGQWPEAVHPLTLGGCMGDGQHVWAAAEWVLMLKNCFVREEGEGLILFSGIPAQWLTAGRTLAMGPVHTRYGLISLRAEVESNTVKFKIDYQWHDQVPWIRCQCPGMEAFEFVEGQKEAEAELGIKL